MKHQPAYLYDLPDFIYVDIDENPIVSQETPETALIAAERSKTLSKEAQQVIQLIFESPAEVLTYGRTKAGTSSNCIRNYLVERLHWRWNLVKRVMKELRNYACND